MAPAARRSDSAAKPGKTAAGRERREEILRVAERLFHKNGYHATSLDDVADAIGFTKPAIYHYFKSKEDILFEIREAIIRDALERTEDVLILDASPAEQLRALLVGHTQMVLQNRRANKIYYEEQGLLSPSRERQIRRLERRYEEVARGLYVDGVAAGELRDIDPAVAIATILGACNWAYRWFRPRGRLKADELAEVMVDLLMNGFVADGT
jgi:TetR/AcrR family transcriptional regulator, cholesterol catabolism regulator